MTPNLGQGGNNAMLSVASFVNHLRALAQKTPSPTVTDLEKAFAGFQKERKGPVEFIVKVTGNYTRWASWRTWFGWLIQSWIWPLVGDRFVIDRMLSPIIKDSIRLDFVEEKNLPPGKVPWTRS
jgi:2-polyprenyl-6-methoxyphenol hydroxylase-like FAD-dependent oxidoreductase